MTLARASRRSVLLGASAALVTGCTADSPPRATRPSSAAPTTAPTDAQEATIFDLSLEETHRFRPFELVAPGFEADVSGGPGRAGPVAPFAAVELRLDGGSGDVAAGLATEGGDHVLVRWSAQSSLLWLSVRRDGRTRVLRRRTVRREGAVGLAFALCENQVTALVDAGEGWRPVLTERSKVEDLVDLRDEAVLAEHRYTWSGEVGEVRAGVFGMTGLRDPHLVQHADGTPYVRDGRVFLTWTCAGLGFFQQAHWTVWSMDPAAPEEMRLEAHLFSRRDGLVLGDHAGQVVRDGNRWLVATSSWGDFAPGRVHVRHTTTTEDVLSGVHVLDTEPTELPSEHGHVGPGVHPARRQVARRLRGEPVAGPLRLPPRPGHHHVRGLVRGAVAGRRGRLTAPVRGADHRHGRRPDLVAGQ